MELINASAHKTGLPDRSVHAIITSPPYWGLRNYDGDQVVDWPAMAYSPMLSLDPIAIPAMTCGLGQERGPFSYIGHLVLVMREMWRVLRDDGTAWVNLGDSFSGSGGAGGDYAAGGIREGQPTYKPPRINIPGKNKILIPHRFALAMQAEGWIVRQDIVWAKGVSCLPSYAGSAMPESVRDRPTNGHEFLFLLSKQRNYFYDGDAVKESGLTGSGGNFARATKDHVIPNQRRPQHRLDRTPTQNTGTRSLRSVWAINPGNYSGAHFAVFPDKLPELCILASTSAEGVCPACGAPYIRQVKRSPMEMRRSERGEQKRADGLRTCTSGTMVKPPTSITTGWKASCDCDAGDPIPATVLDPFNGAGTTGRMAVKHRRHYIGVDLSDEYLSQTQERIAGVQLSLGDLS